MRIHESAQQKQMRRIVETGTKSKRVHQIFFNDPVADAERRVCYHLSDEFRRKLLITIELD